MLGLAAAQTVPRRGDVQANLEEHVRLADEAAGRGAHIVVFPELSLTGYELDLADKLAFREDDPRLEPLVRLARVRKITLVVGAPLREGEGLFIAAFVLAPDGGTDLYTKHHLGAFPGGSPPPEDTVFKPGDRSLLVGWPGGSAAVAVCADAHRAAHARAAAERQASAYLVSAFVVPAEFEEATRNLRTRAADHAMAVVFANFGGPSGGLASAGQSSIWSADGTLVARAPGLGAGLVTA